MKRGPHPEPDHYARAHVVNRSGYPNGSSCFFCGHREAIGIVRDADPETGIVAHVTICETCNAPVPDVTTCGMTKRELYLARRGRQQSDRAPERPGHDPDK